MLEMAVLYMIDGFLRLSNLLYCNYIVQCSSEFILHNISLFAMNFCVVDPD